MVKDKDMLYAEDLIWRVIAWLVTTLDYELSLFPERAKKIKEGKVKVKKKKISAMHVQRTKLGKRVYCDPCRVIIWKSFTNKLQQRSC